jgi:hypothetical protein
MPFIKSITLPIKNVESILFVISLVLPHLPLFYFSQLTAACCTQRTHVCKKKIKKIIEYKAYVENIPAKVKLEALTIEIDTLEYQQTEKIETELKDVDRIRIRKVYACCPGWHSGGS